MDRLALKGERLPIGNTGAWFQVSDNVLHSIHLPPEVPAEFDSEALEQVRSAAGRFQFATEHASPFTRRVWERMRAIPQGQTLSYSALAAEVGYPRAPRAVGGAVGANPFLIVFPCHRVVGKNNLGGFREGLAWKRRLLALEAL